MAEGLNNSNSGNGMMTNVWGPAGWVFLHSVTFGYPMNPDEFDANFEQPPGTTKERYKTFFENSGFVLPCRYCRESYQEFEKVDPVADALDNRESLTRWLWRIHERVNVKLNKPGISYEELVQRYEGYRATCGKDKKGCSVPVGFSNKQRTCVVIYSEVAITSFLIAAIMLVWLVVTLVTTTSKSN
jgi:hypothetical protein